MCLLFDCFRTHNDGMAMVGGDMIDGGYKINKKVLVLTQHDFNILRMTNFVVLDKYDGTLGEYSDEQYEFAYEEVYPVNSNSPIKFVFDIYKSEGKNITDLDYTDRMSKSIPNGYVKKEYTKMKTKEELLNRLYMNQTDTVEVDGLEIPIDGLILQGNYSAYKLKKPYLNTIDFRIRVQDNRLLLETKRVDGKYDYDAFMCPFFDNQYCYLNSVVGGKISSTELEQPNAELPTINYTNISISPRIKKALAEGHKYMLEHFYELDGTFGEFANIDNKWHFMRPRDHPNSSPIAIRIASLIYYPLHLPQNVYFERVAKTQLSTMFHNMSHLLREKIFDIIHEISPNCKTALNIACGRGGDVGWFRKLGIRFTVGIDSDRDAIVDYGLKAPFNCIVHNSYITKHTIPSIIKDLQARRRFRLQDICLINFAIHYFIDAGTDLMQLINALTVPGAATYITFFDSEAIIKDMKNNQLQIDELLIEIENDKLKMPLPTIAKNIYQLENMVTANQIKSINTIKGMVTEIKSLKCTKKEAEAHEFEPIYKYTKYIKLAVIRQK